MSAFRNTERHTETKMARYAARQKREGKRRFVKQLKKKNEKELD